jgi:hypothetical protein
MNINELLEMNNEWSDNISVMQKEKSSVGVDRAFY